LPTAMTSADVVHLLGGVAMTPILLLIAFPLALSTALLSCVIIESLLGPPFCRCPASRFARFLINGMPLLCAAAKDRVKLPPTKSVVGPPKTAPLGRKQCRQPPRRPIRQAGSWFFTGEIRPRGMELNQGSLTTPPRSINVNLAKA
jgi:hypothetical protein